MAIKAVEVAMKHSPDGSNLKWEAQRRFRRIEKLSEQLDRPVEIRDFVARFETAAQN